MNVDVTVYLDGYHGDTSRMYFVGESPVLRTGRRRGREAGPGKAEGPVKVQVQGAGAQGCGMPASKADMSTASAHNIPCHPACMHRRGVA